MPKGESPDGGLYLAMVKYIPNGCSNRGDYINDTF